MTHDWRITKLTTKATTLWSPQRTAWGQHSLLPPRVAWLWSERMAVCLALSSVAMACNANISWSTCCSITGLCVQSCYILRMILNINQNMYENNNMQQYVAFTVISCQLLFNCNHQPACVWCFKCIWCIWAAVTASLFCEVIFLQLLHLLQFFRKVWSILR